MNVIIGDFLVDMRKRSGKTQQQVADRIGVNVTTLRDYERGTSDISAVNLFRIAAFCGYDLKDIFKNFKNFRVRTKVKKGLGKGMQHHHNDNNLSLRQIY